MAITPQDVLLQLLAENDYYIHDILDNVPTDCLYWQADDNANSIGVLIWHVARACDVFMMQHINNEDAENELWFSKGWAEKADYDPRGIGVLGWGMMTEYTQEDIAAIPQMSTDILKGYYSDVSETIRAYLQNVTVETLEAQADGYEGKQTNWFWVRHPLFDMSRHVGEMMLIRGLWQRQAEK